MVERIEDLEYDLKILKKLAPVAAVNYIRKAIGYDEYLTGLCGIPAHEAGRTV